MCRRRIGVRSLMSWLRRRQTVGGRGNRSLPCRRIPRILLVCARYSHFQNEMRRREVFVLSNACGDESIYHCPGKAYYIYTKTDVRRAIRWCEGRHLLGTSRGRGMLHLENALVRKLSHFIRLLPGELECLTTLQSNTRTISSRTEIVYEGQTDHRMYVLQTGWAYSYKLLPNGGQQIISFEIPGDFLGMRSILMRTLDHSIAALTDVVVSVIAIPQVRDAFRAFPRLAAALLWAASRDDAITLEHLAGIGRRSATERVAHFFLELRQRLQLVGLTPGTEFECPITQHLLADALGLTPVHVNRVLRQLREHGLLTIRGHSVVIHDAKKLAKFAKYDGAYLDESRPQVELGFKSRNESV